MRISLKRCKCTFARVCLALSDHIRNEVWPEAKFAALGAFIFLRYEAILSPRHEDIEV